MANVYLWGESDKAKMEFVTAAKEAINYIRKNTGMLIETQKSGG